MFETVFWFIGGLVGWLLDDKLFGCSNQFIDWFVVCVLVHELVVNLCNAWYIHALLNTHIACVLLLFNQLVDGDCLVICWLLLHRVLCC